MPTTSPSVRPWWYILYFYKCELIIWLQIRDGQTKLVIEVLKKYTEWLSKMSTLYLVFLSIQCMVRTLIQCLIIYVQIERFVRKICERETERERERERRKETDSERKRKGKIQGVSQKWRQFTWSSSIQYCTYRVFIKVCYTFAYDKRPTVFVCRWDKAAIFAVMQATLANTL